MNEAQADLVEWEHVFPRCSVLKLRTWNADTVRQGAPGRGAEVRA